MDHGIIEGFCASSCDAGGVLTPADLNTWLNELETACNGRNNNAYASADGACFSDAFFSTVAESQNVYDAFNQARSAVEAKLGVPTLLLQPDPVVDGLYSVPYNGFVETGV